VATASAAQAAEVGMPRRPRRALASLLLGFCAASCGHDAPAEIDYRPLALGDGWSVSTPEQHGIDPAAVRRCYESAANLRNIYGLVLASHGELVAESYFNQRSVSTASPTASVTKSVTSALVGIALQEGLLASLDQPLLAFFPEIDAAALDARKLRITLRQTLQMRSGYPWEERAGTIDYLLSRASWIPLLGEFPLASDPGTAFGYSNLTAHMLGIVVARATSASLYDYARSRLFGPLGVEIASWPRDAQGYYFGSGDLAITARSMAKFGQLYLDDGVWDGARILPEGWVADSWRAYSRNVYGAPILGSIGELDYGYLWWSSVCGRHPVNFAWGHGGQLIFVIPEIDAVLVATAEYLGAQFGDEAWRKESGVMEVTGQCIASL